MPKLRCGKCQLSEKQDKATSCPHAKGRSTLKCSVSGEYTSKGMVCKLTAQTISGIIKDLSGVLHDRLEAASFGAAHNMMD